MQNKEAIEFLQKELDAAYKRKWKIGLKYNTKYIIILEMAIKALEQQSCDTSIEQALLLEVIDKFLPTECDDAISREMALDGIDAMYNNSWDIKNFRENVILLLNKLPSVQPKHGHWIKSDVYENIYNCSKCGSAGYDTFNYCPNCSADMRGNTDADSN